MSKKIQACLSSLVLEQIGRNEVSPDELLAIEEHISECPRCREMFDSHYNSSQWSELIQPALSEAQMADTSVTEDGADHSSAILKLLGPTDDPNMLGRIGNYEIVGVIGQGGMGAVFKGFDRSLNRFVAIKMLLPHLAASGAARKRFAREGQAVAAVVDDHVMAIHCVDEWQGIPYLVMTYSRGVSLQKRLNDHGPFEVREILRIGMQAAKGLSAAHAQGIVHRDIKPSNILLDQNVERVQLVDFGLARAVDDASLTCSGTLAGTPQYMSPEQARAESVDHRSDLFSLGSVLYAMCVGHAPFRAESSYSVLRLIIEKEPRSIREINSDIPDWLCSIIEKLMSKSLEDRYASADEVAIIFEQCLAHVQDPMQHALPAVTRELGKQSKSNWENASLFQRWFPIMNDKRIVSLISLLLLLIALLAPWPIATIGRAESALAFAGTAALLSLVLALLSRTEYFSKIVLWGFGLSFGLGVIGVGISVPIWMQRYSNAKAMQEEYKATSRLKALDAAQAQKQSMDEEMVTQKKESQNRITDQKKEDNVLKRNNLEVDKSKATLADPLDLSSTADASASQLTLPTKDNDRSAIESIQEFCSILGIAEPRFLVNEKASPDIQIGPSEEIVDWTELVDLLNSGSSKDTGDIEVKSKLAGVRRRAVDHLSAQVEFGLTQFLLDNPVWLGQGDAKPSEAAMETLKQKASDKLNELRSAAQIAALDTDLQEQPETAKSGYVVTSYPMKFVSSQKAQATILNTSRLFGVFPEMPFSDIRTNVLIIERNGREKYLTCLAETIDRSGQEEAMSFDERIELWKDRLLLLTILKVAVGADPNPNARSD